MDSPQHKYFLIRLDYGNRSIERQFVAEIMTNFDRDTLTGMALFVNNHPYRPECLLHLTFEKDHKRFEEWLSKKGHNNRRVYNLFLEDMNQRMRKRGYNIATLVDNDILLNELMSSGTGPLFLIPDRAFFDEAYGSAENNQAYKVFLSHSSKDKAVVDGVFNELQKHGTSAWYDRYEVAAGDSITEKINEGLEKSDIGVLFLSTNFLYSKSGWPMAEANYFLQRKMKNKNKKLIVVNIDLAHDQLPPLLQDYRYIDLKMDGSIAELIGAVT